MAFTGSNNHALAGSDEDRPGEWNTLELVCFEDRCVHIANGKVVMALRNPRYQDGGKDVPMKGGKLQIQSEAAEVFYRDIEIRSIPADAEGIRKIFQGLMSFLKSIPPFTTTATFCSTEMSCSGSPFTAMTSPNLSGSIVPTRALQPMYCAATRVAD